MNKKAIQIETLGLIVFGILVLIAVIVLVISRGGDAGNSAWDTAKNSLSGLFG